MDLVGENKIKVIHLPDVSGKGRGHVIPGQGVIKYKEVLKTLENLRPEYMLIEVYLDKENRRLSLREVKL